MGRAARPRAGRVQRQPRRLQEGHQGAGLRLLGESPQELPGPLGRLRHLAARGVHTAVRPRPARQGLRGQGRTGHGAGGPGLDLPEGRGLQGPGHRSRAPADPGRVQQAHQPHRRDQVQRQARPQAGAEGPRLVQGPEVERVPLHHRARPAAEGRDHEVRERTAGQRAVPRHHHLPAPVLGGGEAPGRRQPPQAGQRADGTARTARGAHRRRGHDQPLAADAGDHAPPDRGRASGARGGARCADRAGWTSPPWS